MVWELSQEARAAGRLTAVGMSVSGGLDILPPCTHPWMTLREQVSQFTDTEAANKDYCYNLDVWPRHSRLNNQTTNKNTGNSWVKEIILMNIFLKIWNWK